MATPAGVADSVGTATHDGVTMFTNTMTSEEITSGLAAVEDAKQALDAAKPPVADPADATADKKPNPRKDLSARVAQQSTELANKEQSITALNERLAEIDTLKREIAELKASRQPAPQTVAKPKEPQGFTDPEPTLADFPIDKYADAPDPYGAQMAAYARSLSAFDRKKEAFEAKQVQQKESARTDFETWVKQGEEAHDARLSAHFAAHPEDRAVLDTAADLPLTPILYAAVERHERGAEMLVELAKHPDFVDDLVLQTQGHPPIDAQRNFNPLVSIVQRKILSRLAAAVNGSASPAPKKTTAAHPPISPVAGTHPMPKGGPPDPHSTTQEEWDAYWNNEEKERRRGGSRR